MLKKSVAFTVLIYGILLAVFGMLGYVKGGSVVSFVIGGASGALLILCALAIFSKNILGAYIALLTTFFLTATFAYRYTLSGKPIAGFLTVLSGGVLLFLFAHSAKWKK